MTSPVGVFCSVVSAVLLMSLAGNARASMAEMPVSDQRLVHEVVEKTNQERGRHGLPPLKIQNELTQAAQDQAGDMVRFRYFRHSTPAGAQDFDTYTKAAHYLYPSGQNLYRGGADSDMIFTALFNSPEHRENMLDSQYNEIGVGLVASAPEQRSYCVQNFGIHKDCFPVVVNNEAYSTDNPLVHLYLYGKGRIKRMRFSNDGITFSAWEPFQSERDWTVSNNAGAHTIYVELDGGHCTYRSADTILLAHGA